MKDRLFEAVLVAGALALGGCTPAGQQTASQFISGADLGCILVVSVVDPAAEPLCITGEELATAIAAFVAAHGSAPAVATSADGKTVLPAEVHAALAAKPAIKARKVAPKCRAGQVAP